MSVHEVNSTNFKAGLLSNLVNRLHEQELQVAKRQNCFLQNVISDN